MSRQELIKQIKATLKYKCENCKHDLGQNRMVTTNRYDDNFDTFEMIAKAYNKSMADVQNLTQLTYGDEKLLHKLVRTFAGSCGLLHKRCWRSTIDPNSSNRVNLNTDEYLNLTSLGLTQHKLEEDQRYCYCEDYEAKG